MYAIKHICECGNTYLQLPLMKNVIECKSFICSKDGYLMRTEKIEISMECKMTFKYGAGKCETGSYGSCW